MGAQVTELKVAGMTCGNCARHVTDAVRAVPGVEHATVALETQRATIRWKDRPDLEAALGAIKGAGYDAAPQDEHSHGHKGGRSKAPAWGVNVLTGVLPTVVLMAGEWIFGWQHHGWF